MHRMSKVDAAELAALREMLAYARLDREGKIVQVNSQFQQLTGYSQGQIAGRHHRVLLPEGREHIQAFEQLWQDLQRGEPLFGLYERVSKDGQPLLLRSFYCPIAGPKGQVIGVALYASDQSDMLEERAMSKQYATEVSGLYNAVRDGRLSFRADTSQLSPQYAEMMRQIHSIIDVIVAPIEELLSQMSRFCEGDLTAYIEGERHGDHAKLKDQYNQVLDELNTILNKIRNASDQIMTGSDEVASSSHVLSNGATRQAAALEQIATSIAQMSDKINDTAVNATDAAELAGKAGGLAKDGDQRMKAMVEAMGEIKESSNSISQIIKVIDEIAFQTNLLALNAAV
ncbi:MAG: methyl-accepting chemotaxis protein, partial [Myxococcota bacterium]